ncbi:MAG: phosphopyruvate hydratase, partial [Faecalibacterium sp.]|nr:phosphopyruvate hydratase [Faecalibacterium sp.]
LATAVGDEGGFAPDCADDAHAIELILQAVEQAGYRPGKDILLALDAAASEWRTENGYRQPKSGNQFQRAGLIDYWAHLCEDYPIASIEDPLGEEDWEGWGLLTHQLGRRVQLVGDDLFVTNTARLRRGMEEGCGNSILVKPNQIGTLSQTIGAVQLARSNGYSAIISHRSGETSDTTIADLAVGLNTGLIKTGAPCRAERTEKYNRLLRIEQQLGDLAVWPGGRMLSGRR